MRPLKRLRKAGSVEDARLVLWRAVTAAENALYAAAETGDVDGVLRSVHAVAQSAATYGKLTETANLERRVAELEEEAQRART